MKREIKVGDKEKSLKEILDNIKTNINVNDIELSKPSENPLQKTPIESDGGSSSYYFTKLPKWMIDQIVETGGIEIKDIVYFVFDNDAHAKDIIKAQKRIIEQRKGGGKAGLKPLYDEKKIIFFSQDQYDIAKNNLDERNNNL